jgi:hypothetical protein
LLKGRVRRTPLSCSSGVGVLGVGGLDVGIVSKIFGLGGFPRRFLIIGGVGWGNLAVVLDVRGVVFLAVRSVRAGNLAIFHHVGLDEMLGKKKKVIREFK